MVQILGVVDIIASAILFSFLLQIPVPWEALVFIPICLLCKSVLYLADIGSWTDIFVFLLIITGIFFHHLPSLILLIGAVLIFVKGVMSLIVIM